MKKRFIIVYNQQPYPFEAKSKEEILTRIRKDWSRSENSEASVFETCGIIMMFSDYAQGKFDVFHLDEWFENRIQDAK